MKAMTYNSKSYNSKRDQWPFVRWIRSKNAWQVDARTKSGGHRRFFKTADEAENWAIQQRAQRNHEGSLAFDNSVLKQFGWTVADAVRFAEDHLRRKAASVPVAEAITRFTVHKQNRVCARRLTDMKQRLNRVTTALGEKLMADVDADDLTTFLDSFDHPATKNTYRKEIVALWRWARSQPRGWTQVAIDNVTVPLEKEPEKARKILTVPQAAALMAASTDPEMRALNALVLFGGLRVEEVEKLDWADVDFRTGHVNVSAEKSKVRTERFAPMPENLRAWLAGLPEAAAKRRDERLSKAADKGRVVKASEAESNPIVTRTLMHVLRDTAKRAKIKPWPQNAHRHSFISYRRQLIGDAQTALDAGTSERIIKRHYKRPVLKEDAEAYFKILPGSVET